jgi:hypothetical protein
MKWKRTTMSEKIEVQVAEPIGVDHRQAYERACAIRREIRTLMLELWGCERIVYKVMYGVDLSWEEFKAREK